VHGLYNSEQFHFSYYGFDWLPTIPLFWLKVIIITMSVVSLLFSLGFCYRLSATLFFLGFAYIYLLEATLYLNHFYLVILLSMVLIFIPANQTFSLDAWFTQSK
jgi:hypothetical protein